MAETKFKQNQAVLAEAWTAYTPTISASSGTFTTATATLYYRKIGKTIHVRGSMSITTKGTASGNILLSLPVAGVTDPSGTGVARERAVNGYLCQIYSDTTNMTIIKYDNTSIIGDGVGLSIGLTYEAA